jgi:aspartate/methionine/tyrosine aminotransferase
MSVKRLEGIPGFSIDRVAAEAERAEARIDPAEGEEQVLRLENLDTDLAPPAVAVAATEQAIRLDQANSYLPFIGSADLRGAVARHLGRQSGQRYDPESEVVITSGGTEGMFDSLLTLTDPGDEVILTDPTYAGMTNRVRLAGAVPRLVPFVIEGGAWRLDLEALRAAVNDRTRAVFLMNPSMPSGAVLDAEEWAEVARLCSERSLWLLYNAAMERILFDGRPCIHPASLPGMRERTLTIGSVSKEYRMIGWRIGWVVGPASVLTDVAKVHTYNVVTPTGIAQAAAAAALDADPQDVAECVVEWQRRRDVILEELKDLPAIKPAGGWSLLLDVSSFGHDSFTASRLLLERGRVAATPMRYWGDRNGDRYVRLVYSKEPVARLAGLRERVLRALQP